MAKWCLAAIFALSLSRTSVSPAFGLAASNLATQSKPIVYTIAGSDSGGGAGIQADLHAIHSFGCHGCSAITCLTAQNSVAVTDVHAPPLEFFQAQLDALRSDLPPTAVKVGMLGTRELAVQVGDFLRSIKEHDPSIWVVVDPVMISTSGARLIEEDAQQAMVDHVFPYADVLTPNKHEAEALLGKKLNSIEDVESAARALLTLGIRSVLIKGGHSNSDSEVGVFAQDYFLAGGSIPKEPRLCDGSGGVWLRSVRHDSENTHGTGCTLSSSIASALALGEVERRKSADASRRGVLSSIYPTDACCLAKAYVSAGIYEGMQLGKGPGPVAQTRFPDSAEHYPSIVVDPQADNRNSRPFKPMMPCGSSTKDGVVKLGSILPVVDSIDWVRRICQTGGISDIQLRIKNETDRDRILEQVRLAQRICTENGVRLWVNDHWEAAVEAGCFGVHMGQEDLCKCVHAGGLDVMRRKGLALGLSTHSYGELSAALGVKPSYISLGPVFATSSKKVKFDPQGLSTVSKWRQLIPDEIPVVCIGGINNDATARDVHEAGADCVAVIGAVTSAPDVEVAVSELNHAMQTLAG